jgi:hypothetical protein
LTELRYEFLQFVCENLQRAENISKQQDFSCDSVLITQAVLQIAADGPKVRFAVDSAVRERIFSFSEQLETE